MTSRLGLDFLTRLAFAFILATSHWFMYTYPLPPKSALRLFDSVIAVPRWLAAAIWPEGCNFVFLPTKPAIDLLFGQGAWTELPRDMIFYVGFFYLPACLRLLDEKLASSWASSGLTKALHTLVSAWDKAWLKIPRAAGKLLQRAAFAYLATLTVTIFYSLNTPEIHDPITYGLQGLLDMPLTMVGALVPFADRGFDFWFSNAFHGKGNFGERYLIHMRFGTLTYLALFYIPELYVAIRRRLTNSNSLRTPFASK